MLRQHVCYKNIPFFSSSNSSRQSNIKTLFIHSVIRQRTDFRWRDVKMTAGMPNNVKQKERIRRKGQNSLSCAVEAVGIASGKK